MSTLMRRRVVLVKRTVTGQDEYGNDVLTGSEVELRGYNVQPRSSSEDVAARDQVVSGLVLRGPYDARLAAADAIRVDGLEYEIDGDVGRSLMPRSSRRMAEVSLRRVTG